MISIYVVEEDSSVQSLTVGVCCLHHTVDIIAYKSRLVSTMVLLVCGQTVYVRRHMSEQFFLGDVADGFVLPIHADVLDVVNSDFKCIKVHPDSIMAG